jgi:hypothetical protein
VGIATSGFFIVAPLATVGKTQRVRYTSSPFFGGCVGDGLEMPESRIAVCKTLWILMMLAV